MSDQLPPHEIKRIQRENDYLRSLLPALGAPCAYCKNTDISKCPHGFPGCPQADDIICGEDEFLRYMILQHRSWHLAADKLAFAAMELVKFVESQPPWGEEFKALDSISSTCGAALKKYEEIKAGILEEKAAIDFQI